MIHYRRILELHGEGLSLRAIAASTGHARQIITEVVQMAEKKGLGYPLDEKMNNQWIEDFLFPEKSMKASVRQPIDFDYIHKELAKPNVTLLLLHYELQPVPDAQTIHYNSKKYTIFETKSNRSRRPIRGALSHF